MARTPGVTRLVGESRVLWRAAVVDRFRVDAVSVGPQDRSRRVVGYVRAREGASGSAGRTEFTSQQRNDHVAISGPGMRTTGP